MKKSALSFLVAALAAWTSTGLQAAAPASAETRAVAETARQQAAAPVKAAHEQVAAQATAVTDKAAAQVNAVRDQVKDKLKPPVKLPKFDVPNLAQAAKTRRATVDDSVTSPRTLTYKSRASRISRWIAPLTAGLITYIPFDTNNASAAGTMNNLMAEEKISVESMAAESFAAHLQDSQRWSSAAPAEASFKIEIDRYALDPVPTSISLLRPTVSLTGRLFDNDGKLLWIGKGFTSSIESGIKGATLEQYEANPEVLRKDFQTAVQTATKRLAAQANAVPKASVKVVSSSR